MQVNCFQDKDKEAYVAFREWFMRLPSISWTWAQTSWVSYCNWAD
jgi:hypothetical protein